MKKYLLISLLIVAGFSSEAQILKKIKEKVNNTLEKKVEAVVPVNPSVKPDTWCKTDTLDAQYSLVYSGANKFTILYDESCLGTGIDGNGYTMVLTEIVNGKPSYFIMENGKEKARYTAMKDQYLPCPASTIKSEQGALSSKYIITDSAKFLNSGVAAQKITTQKIDGEKALQGMEIAKQTDEYKKMSAEEKKQFDELMKSMPQITNEYNKNLANKTFETAEIKASSGYTITGYRVVVNKKEYGKFGFVQSLVVSPDEKNVFVLANDANAGRVYVANDKKINLQAKGFSGTGILIVNEANNRSVYAEMKQKTSEAAAQDLKDYENAIYIYRILRPDGTVTEFPVTGSFGTADFKLSNKGNLVYVHPKTGEVFADGKPIGKFHVSAEDADELTGDKLLLGDAVEKICFYSSDGSLNFLDGSKKKMGIIFPKVITANGKTTINWFRQCNNEIYIGKMNF
jgi:hypothetical protein